MLVHPHQNSAKAGTQAIAVWYWVNKALCLKHHLFSKALDVSMPPSSGMVLSASTHSKGHHPFLAGMNHPGAQAPAPFAGSLSTEENLRVLNPRILTTGH